MHLTNLIHPTGPVKLMQSTQPSQPHPVKPYPVSLTQSTSFSHPHPANIIHHPQLFLRLISTQTIWKEGRKYRVTEAEEGEPYVQYSFSHWVLNETAHKFKERYLIGNQGNFRDEQDLRCYASTKIPSPIYEGREVPRTFGYGSAWTTVRCFHWSWVSLIGGEPC